MTKQIHPILIITAVISLLLVLTWINAADDSELLGPASDSRQPAQQYREPGKSPEQLLAEIEKTTPSIPGPPTPTQMRVQDRDDEGSSAWWTDTTSPTDESATPR